MTHVPRKHMSYVRTAMLSGGCATWSDKPVVELAHATEPGDDNVILRLALKAGLDAERKTNDDLKDVRHYAYGARRHAETAIERIGEVKALEKFDDADAVCKTLLDRGSMHYARVLSVLSKRFRLPRKRLRLTVSRIIVSRSDRSIPDSVDESDDRNF